MQDKINNTMLKVKVGLVTGSSRGVGRGVAMGLCEYVAKVYITGRNILKNVHNLLEIDRVIISLNI